MHWLKKLHAATWQTGEQWHDKGNGGLEAGLTELEGLEWTTLGDRTYAIRVPHTQTRIYLAQACSDAIGWGDSYVEKILEYELYTYVVYGLD